MPTRNEYQRPLFVDLEGGGGGYSCLAVTVSVFFSQEQTPLLRGKAREGGGGSGRGRGRLRCALLLVVPHEASTQENALAHYFSAPKTVYHVQASDKVQGSTCLHGAVQCSTGHHIRYTTRKGRAALAIQPTRGQ